MNHGDFEARLGDHGQPGLLSQAERLALAAGTGAGGAAVIGLARAKNESSIGAGRPKVFGTGRIIRPAPYLAYPAPLGSLGFTPQKPEYRDRERDDQEIEFFLNEKFPRIQRLADKLGAEIGFQDEAGVGIMTRQGKTWGLRGQTPVIEASMKRGGYNVLSIVTPEGTLRYSIQDGNPNGDKFIEFLK